MEFLTHWYPDEMTLILSISVLAQITVIAGIALLAIRLIGERNAAARHAVGVGALLAVFLCPLLTKAWQTAHLTLWRVPVASAVSSSHAEALKANAPPLLASGVLEMGVPPVGQDIHAPIARSIPVVPHRAGPSLLPVCIGSVVLIWLTGIVALILRLAYGLGRQQVFCQSGVVCESGKLQVALKQVRSRIRGEMPPVVESRALDVPLAAGFIWPRIILPEGMIQRLKLEELCDVLAHECSHVMRKDHWVGLLQRVVEILFWPHPLVHALNRRIARAREEVCDNHVLAYTAPQDYAQTLFNLAQGFPPQHRLPATAQLISPDWKLEERIHGLLNQRRCIMTHANRWVFVTTILLSMGAVTLSGVQETQKDPVAAQDQTNDVTAAKIRVDNVLKEFATLKLVEMQTMSEKLHIAVPQEFTQIATAIRDGAPFGDVMRQYYALKARSGQYENSVSDPKIMTALWSGPTLELAGAHEQFKNWNPAMLELYAKLVLESLPTGSVLFAGTDPGRFVTTAFQQAKGAPDIIILTQNALCAETYDECIRARYGDKLKLPSTQEVTSVFQFYVTNAIAGSVQIDKESNRVKVNGVQSVMAVNGILSKWIVDANPERQYFLEESYVIPWMFPYLEPQGVLLRLNSKPMDLSEQTIESDRLFWAELTKKLLMSAEFNQDTDARKTFSKMRVAIAGVYEERTKIAEAEAAFKQAIAIYPLSLEAYMRLADFFMRQKRYQDAEDLMTHYVTVDFSNESAKNFLKEISKFIHPGKPAPSESISTGATNHEENASF